MNYQQCFAMILVVFSLAACQSETEQSPAPQQAASPPAVAGKTAPGLNKQTPVPAPAPRAIHSTQSLGAAEHPQAPAHQAVVTTPAHSNMPIAVQVSGALAVKHHPTVVSNKQATQTLSADLSALNKCKACHSIKAKIKVGPGLGKGHGIPGVFGRKAGTFPGFKYKFTQYIKPGKAWVWDEEHLRQWECNSRKAIKIFTGDAKARTKMPPQHICNPDKQDAMIAALRSIS